MLEFTIFCGLTLQLQQVLLENSVAQSMLNMRACISFYSMHAQTFS